MTFEQFTEQAVATVAPVFPEARVHCEVWQDCWFIHVSHGGDRKDSMAVAAEPLASAEASDARVWDQIRTEAERAKARRSRAA